MKRSVVASLIVISICMLNIFPIVHPAKGYIFNINSNDVGKKIEYEVKIYDQNQWRKHIGKNITTDKFFPGDSDVIGAKLKQTIDNFYSDEGMYFLENYTFIDYIIESNSEARMNISSLLTGAIASYYGPLIAIMNASILVTVASLLGMPGPYSVAYDAFLHTNMTMAQTSQNIINSTEALSLYGKKYNGTIMIGDKWNFKKGEFSLAPDVEDEMTQFLADPLDWYDSFTRLIDFKLHQLLNLTYYKDLWYQLYFKYFNGASYPVFPYNLMTADDIIAYIFLNGTLYFAFQNFMGLTNEEINTLYGVPNDLSAVGGGNYQYDFVLGTYLTVDAILTTIIQNLNSTYPDKFGYLFKFLNIGLPTYAPVNEYLEKAIEEFNIDDSTLYKLSGLEVGRDKNLDGKINPITGEIVSDFGIDLGGETVYVYGYVNVSVDDRNVIITIDYQDGQIDPADASFFGGDENEFLEDWEAIFTYRNNGILDSIVFKNSTAEFYRLEFLEAIDNDEENGNGNGNTKLSEVSYESLIMIWGIAIIVILALIFSIIYISKKKK